MSHPVIRALARGRGVSAAALVLAWHLQRDAVPLPSSSSPVHIAENFASLDFELDATARQTLDGLESNDLTVPERAP